MTTLFISFCLFLFNNLFSYLLPAPAPMLPPSAECPMGSAHPHDTHLSRPLPRVWRPPWPPPLIGSRSDGMAHGTFPVPGIRSSLDYCCVLLCPHLALLKGRPPAPRTMFPGSRSPARWPGLPPLVSSKSVQITPHHSSSYGYHLALLTRITNENGF